MLTATEATSTINVAPHNPKLDTILTTGYSPKELCATSDGTPDFDMKAA